jgi:hypothetical protein
LIISEGRVNRVSRPEPRVSKGGVGHVRQMAGKRKHSSGITACPLESILKLVRIFLAHISQRVLDR